MKIIRTLIGEFSEEEVDFLKQFGIKVKANTLERFYIDEGDDYYRIYDHLSETLRKSRSYGYELARLNRNRIYKYTKKDVEDSKFCKLRVVLGGGYPQPEHNFEYCQITYDGSSICPKCSLPMNQINNFRVKKISNRPIWGFTSWVYDVIFAHEEFYKQVFEPLGIKCRPIEKTSGSIWEGVVQLIIPTTGESIKLPYHDVIVCPQCGSLRYRPWGTLPFFPEYKYFQSPIFLTKEYFGGGLDSSHYIIISSKLAIQLLELKAIKLEDLTPCRKDFEENLKNNPDLIPYRR